MSNRKMALKMTNNMMGSANEKITDSRPRKNCVSSSRPGVNPTEGLPPEPRSAALRSYS